MKRKEISSDAADGSTTQVDDEGQHANLKRAGKRKVRHVDHSATDDYQPGFLSSLLSGTSADEPRKKKKKAKEPEEAANGEHAMRAVAALFARPSAPLPAPVAPPTDSLGDSLKQPEKTPEKIIKKNAKKRQQKTKGEGGKRDHDSERDSRTLFVGNVPLNVKKDKVLDALGVGKPDVESIRFRSVPVSPKWMNQRKAGVIKKEYAGTAGSQVAYVVFREKEGLDEFLHSRDDIELSGHLLRLDRADSGSAFSKFDRKRTVFVGGLPREAQEDDVRQHFSQVGPVKAVRIIRDKATFMCKGIGFVHFADRSHVVKATQQLHQQPFGPLERPLRVTKVLKEEEAKLQKEQTSMRKPGKRKAAPSRAAPKVHPAERRIQKKSPVGVGKVEGRESARATKMKKARSMMDRWKKRGKGKGSVRKQAK